MMLLLASFIFCCNIYLFIFFEKNKKSCENLPSDVENGGLSVAEGGGGGSLHHHHKTSTSENAESSAGGAVFSGSQMDAVLLQLEQGVEVALHRAKLWSKYAKDIMTYVEKRCNLETEFAKNVAKLAQTMKSALKEEVKSETKIMSGKALDHCHFFLFSATCRSSPFT